MTKTILILSGIVVIFSILALSYQLNNTANRDSEQQDSINQYIAMEKSANNLLDMCTRNGEVIKDDKCKEGALTIISACNSLKSRLPICDDPRISKLIFTGDDIEEKTDLSNTSELIKNHDSQSEKTIVRDIDALTTLFEKLKPILQVNDDFASTLKKYSVYASNCYSATKNPYGQDHADVGMDVINNLSILGFENSEVIEEWHYLLVGVNNMCPTDLSRWIEKMNLTAGTTALSDMDMEFFNQQMKLANDALLRNQSNEPLKFKKEYMLSKLHEYSETLNKEKVTLTSNYEQLPPKYIPLFTKIIEYVDAISLSIDKSTNIIGSYDLQTIDEANEQFKITVNLKDELTRMIEEELNSSIK